MGSEEVMALKNLRIETNGNTYLKENECGIVIPCSPIKLLICDKPKKDEEDICPICKAKIYATSYGQVGHY